MYTCASYIQWIYDLTDTYELSWWNLTQSEISWLLNIVRASYSGIYLFIINVRFVMWLINGLWTHMKKKPLGFKTPQPTFFSTFCTWFIAFSINRWEVNTYSRIKCYEIVFKAAQTTLLINSASEIFPLFIWCRWDWIILRHFDMLLQC